MLGLSIAQSTLEIPKRPSTGRAERGLFATRDFVTGEKIVPIFLPLNASDGEILSIREIEEFQRTCALSIFMPENSHLVESLRRNGMTEEWLSALAEDSTIASRFATASNDADLEMPLDDEPVAVSARKLNEFLTRCEDPSLSRNNTRWEKTDFAFSKQTEHDGSPLKVSFAFSLGFVVAKRPIKLGEELFRSYGYAYWHDLLFPHVLRIKAEMDAQDRKSLRNRKLVLHSAAAILGFAIGYMIIRFWF